MLQYHSYNHTLHTDTYIYILYTVPLYQGTVYIPVADKSGKKKFSYPNLAQACSADGPLIYFYPLIDFFVFFDKRRTSLSLYLDLYLVDKKKS